MIRVRTVFLALNSSLAQHRPKLQPQVFSRRFKGAYSFVNGQRIRMRWREFTK